MLTVDDLVRECPVCHGFHPQRMTCVEARAEQLEWREQVEKHVADILNKAFEEKK